MSLIRQWYSREGSTQVRVEKNNWAPIFTGGSFHQKLFTNRVLVWFCTWSQEKDICKQIWPINAEFREKKKGLNTIKWSNDTTMAADVVSWRWGNTLFWCDTTLWHLDPVFFSGFGISGSYSLGGHLSYCDHLQNQINTHCVQILVKWPRSKAWW